MRKLARVLVACRLPERWRRAGRPGAGRRDDDTADRAAWSGARRHGHGHRAWFGCGHHGRADGDGSGAGNVYNRERASADRSVRREHAAPARERAGVAGDAGRGVRGHGGRPPGVRDGAVVHDAVAHRAVAVVAAPGGAQRPDRTACAGRRHQCDGTIALAGRDGRDAVDGRAHDGWGGACHRDRCARRDAAAEQPLRVLSGRLYVAAAGAGAGRAAVAAGRGRGR